MTGVLSGKSINLLSGKALEPFIFGVLGLALVLMVFAFVMKRRSVVFDATTPGLYGVTGRFGSGKSYFLTWMASICLKRGRLVFCTYEIVGFRTFEEWQAGFEAGELWIGPVLVENWSQIINVPAHSTVLVDEAQGWWPSDAWNAPVEVKMWLSTIRHRGITVWWGTQWVNSVARWLRELSFGIWECEQYKVGHRYTLYDPKVIGGKKGTRSHDARIVLRRSKDVQAMYDTYNASRHSVEWGGGDEPSRGGVAVQSVVKGAIVDRGPVTYVSPF